MQCICTICWIPFRRGAWCVRVDPRSESQNASSWPDALTPDQPAAVAQACRLSGQLILRYASGSTKCEERRAGDEVYDVPCTSAVCLHLQPSVTRARDEHVRSANPKLTASSYLKSESQTLWARNAIARSRAPEEVPEVVWISIMGASFLIPVHRAEEGLKSSSSIPVHASFASEGHQMLSRSPFLMSSHGECATRQLNRLSRPSASPGLDQQRGRSRKVN